jgi:flagellar biosynthesis protein FlhG
MNQVKNEKEAFAVFNKIKKVAFANIGEHLDLKLIGKIDENSKVSSSVKQRALVSVTHPSSQPHKDIVAIANNIIKKLERDVLVTPNESGLSGLFKRLMGHF